MADTEQRIYAHDLPSTVKVVTMGTGETRQVALCCTKNDVHMCAKSVGHYCNTGAPGTRPHLCLCGVEWEDLDRGDQDGVPSDKTPLDLGICD